MSIGTQIAYCRKQRGLTQEQLSERVGVTSQAVSKWENGVTCPDISLLPAIAGALSVDLNTLFADGIPAAAQLPFTKLADAEYDAMADLYLAARRSFYGENPSLSDEERKNRLQNYREQLRARRYRTLSACEGEDCHGSVFLSDAFSFVDRHYGTAESALLFDMQKAGEILSVLGNADVRKVLREIYRGFVTSGEAGMEKTAEELAAATGLTAERVEDAAGRLAHIRLLDIWEKIENGTYQKRYRGLYTYDFVYVSALFRIACILAEDATYDTQMHRGADGTANYDGAENA